MAWWISLMLLSMAALLWRKSLDSTDDVIALLERILATTLVLVVVLVVLVLVKILPYYPPNKVFFSVLASSVNPVLDVKIVDDLPLRFLINFFCSVCALVFLSSLSNFGSTVTFSATGAGGGGGGGSAGIFGVKKLIT